MLFSLLSLLDPHDSRQAKKSCFQCGQCCESFGGHLTASSQDLLRWREHGREDLLAKTNRLGWIWVDPETKQLIKPCPHIVRTDPEHAHCSIYDDRPDMCRSYPTLAHGKRCLHGVFLSWWSSLCCSPMVQWVGVLEEIPLAA